MNSSRENDALTLDTSSLRGRLAAIGGVLQGEVTDGHACFWVTGPGGGITSFVWPRGHIAKDDPLRVETADGTVRATVGEPLTGIGGHGLESPGCRPGSRQFIVREINP